MPTMPTMPTTTTMTIQYDLSPEEDAESKRAFIPAGSLVPPAPAAPRRPGRAVVVWAPFFVVAASAFWLLSSKTGGSTGARWSVSRDAWIGIIGLAAAVALVVSSIAFSGRGAARANRERARRWRYTFDVADGVRRDEPGAWQRWPWPRFHSFAETDNLYVLRLSPHEGLVIPKRLFPDPATAGAFREMSLAHIGAGVSGTTTS